nr:hypothetical protein [Curtobacterium sp. MCPF17_018]
MNEHPVRRGAVDAEVPGDDDLGDASTDEAACFADLVVVEPAGAALVLAGGLGDPDAFALALVDRGAFELGECAEKVEPETTDRVVGVATVGLLLLQELDGGSVGGDLVAEVAEGARESVSRCDSDGDGDGVGCRVRPTRRHRTPLRGRS